MRSLVRGGWDESGGAEDEAGRGVGNRVAGERLGRGEPAGPGPGAPLRARGSRRGWSGRRGRDAGGRLLGSSVEEKKEKGGDNIPPLPQGKVSVFVCVQWAIVSLIPP